MGNPARSGQGGRPPIAWMWQMKLLSVNGVRLVLGDLVTAFQRETGHAVTVELGEAGDLRRRIEAGADFDAAILPRSAVAVLGAAQRIAPGAVDAVRAVFGLGARDGTVPPDAETTDGLRVWLRTASAIVCTDPATGGVSGVFFARVLDALGIAAQVRAKSRLVAGMLNAELVARGEADIAVQMRHELLAVPGIAFVRFPPEYRDGDAVVFTACVSVAARDPGAADALVRFLAGPIAAPLIRAGRMEPADG